ncbi:MAG: hypothetical protein LUE93_16405 [Bacteroides sp.]|nr:hypothetical protein [Bacteroides sp.]
MKELLVKIGLLSVMFAFTLTACFDENSLGTDKPEGGEDEEEAYFSLNFNTGSTLGGRSNDKEDSGTPNERHVNSIRLILYDAISETAMYVYDLDASNVSDSGEKYFKVRTLLQQ